MNHGRTKREPKATDADLPKLERQVRVIHKNASDVSDFLFGLPDASGGLYELAWSVEGALHACIVICEQMNAIWHRRMGLSYAQQGKLRDKLLNEVENEKLTLAGEME